MRIRSIVSSLIVGILAVAFGLAVTAAPAQAGEVAVNLSNITFVGANLCGPSGTSVCTEVFNFTVDFNTSTSAFSNVSVSASGPLGTYTVVNLSTFMLGTSSSGLVIGLLDTGGDQFEVFTPQLNPGMFPSPGSYSLFDVLGFACNTPTCLSDFGDISPTSGTITVTALTATTPEPSSLLLLGTGLLGLGPFIRRRFAKS